jgi:protein O-mannosyl-transferase
MAARCLSVSQRRSIAWLVPIGLGLAVFASFAPALQNDFVNWDDDLNLTDNAAYRGLGPSQLYWMVTTTLGGHFQPLTWLSFALDHAVWGMAPFGYHLTNLALHAANAVLVWLLLQVLLRPGGNDDPASRDQLAGAAAVGAFAFALHPLRVESVAWATERRDVLSGFFWLLALLAYVRAVEGPEVARRRGLRLALGALVLSLAAKAWGMTFPLVLVLLDAYPLRRLARDPRAVLREKLPFAIVAALGAVLAFAAQRTVPDMRSLAEHGPTARLAQAAYGLCFYLAKTLAPLGLHPAYLLETDLDPFRPRYLLATAIVGAITLTAIALRKRQPWWLATWATYVVIVAPVLGLAQTGPQLVADRYSYLACLPWTALLAAALTRLQASALRRTAWIAAVAAGLVLAVLTYHQTTVWRSSRTLWDHVLAIDPQNWVAYTNRGWVQEDPNAALADYTAAIQANPHYYLAYFDRGNVCEARGDWDGASADYAMAIRLLPDDPKAYNNRGWVRQQREDWSGAASDYERALVVAPPDWWARARVTANLATVRARMVANGR